jgi:type II secretory pathway component PulC
MRGSRSIAIATIAVVVGTVSASRPPAAAADPPPAKPRTQVTRGASSPVAQVDLGLEVVGIILSGNESVAILRDSKTNAEARYTVGATVRGGRVAAIGTDRVTIERPDGRVVLRLGASANPRAPRPTVVTRVEPPSAPAPAHATPAPATPAPAQATTPPVDRFKRLDRTQLESLMQRDQRRLAVPEEGGVRIRAVPGGSVLEVLELQAGDLVRSINGQPPGAQASLGELLQQAVKTPLIRVHVERAGRTDMKYFRVTP